MADENVLMLNYTDSEFQVILEKASNAITKETVTIKGENEQTTTYENKYYITPKNGGIGNILPSKNDILVGSDNISKLQCITPLLGAFYYDNEKGELIFNTLPVKCGGTGVTTLEDLKKQIGINTVAKDVTSSITDPIAVASGGTGLNKIEKNEILIGKDDNSISSISLLDNPVDYILVSNGKDKPPSFKNPADFITSVGTISDGNWQGSIIQPKYGGTGCESLNAFSKIFLQTETINDPIPAERGGTGVTSYDNLITALKNDSFTEFILTNINVTKNIISKIITIDSNETELELATEHLGCLLQLNPNKDSTITITLPDKIGPYEIELFNKGEGTVQIVTDSDKPLFFIGDTATKVKILERYSPIGIKHLSEDDGWLISGGVEEVT